MFCIHPCILNWKKAPFHKKHHELFVFRKTEFVWDNKILCSPHILKRIKGWIRSKSLSVCILPLSYLKSLWKKMKLFQSVKNFYQTMGVYTPQSDHQVHSINSHFLFFSLSMTSNFISIFAYFLFKAISIEDYGSSFNKSMAGLSASANFFIIFWQMPTVLRLIENCEQFIEKSKKNQKISMQISKITIQLNRSGKWVNFKGNVHQIEWNDWTNLEIDLLCHGSIIICCRRFTTNTINIDQLFHLWFARWIISRDSNDVCSKQFSLFLFWQNDTMILFNFDFVHLNLGCHSITKHQQDTCAAMYFKLLEIFAYCFLRCRLWLSTLEHAYWLIHLWMISKTICRI